ncbi:hypothetical protein [Chlamydiifrater phoenicopteri]|uniref:hypothetical protein n=1 Tax=Chlamydiifrater phoenicopteri TaxID=2681469 RepID=UPI001BD176DB|nr:hypothetical protein [Chlamydiifrater phoenicopteri]
MTSAVTSGSSANPTTSLSKKPSLAEHLAKKNLPLTNRDITKIALIVVGLVSATKLFVMAACYFAFGSAIIGSVVFSVGAVLLLLYLLAIDARPKIFPPGVLPKELHPAHTRDLPLYFAPQLWQLPELEDFSSEYTSQVLQPYTVSAPGISGDPDYDACALLARLFEVPRDDWKYHTIFFRDCRLTKREIPNLAREVDGLILTKKKDIISLDEQPVFITENLTEELLTQALSSTAQLSQEEVATVAIPKELRNHLGKLILVINDDFEEKTSSSLFKKLVQTYTAIFSVAIQNKIRTLQLPLLGMHESIKNQVQRENLCLLALLHAIQLNLYAQPEVAHFRVNHLPRRILERDPKLYAKVKEYLRDPQKPIPQKSFFEELPLLEHIPADRTVQFYSSKSEVSKLIEQAKEKLQERLKAKQKKKPAETKAKEEDKPEAPKVSPTEASAISALLASAPGRSPRKMQQAPVEEVSTTPEEEETSLPEKKAPETPKPARPSLVPTEPSAPTLKPTPVVTAPVVTEAPTLIRTPVVTTPTPPTAPLPAPVVTAPVVTEAPTLIRTPVVTTPTPPTAPLPAPVVTAPVVTEAPTLIRTPVVTTPTPPTAPLPAPVVTAPVVTEAPTLIHTPVVTTPTPPTAPLPAPVVTAPVVTEAPTLIRTPVVTTPTPPTAPLPAPVVTAPVVTEAPTLIRTPVVTTPTPPTAPLPAPVVTAPVVTEAPTLIHTPVVTTPTPPTAPLPAPVVTAPVVTEAPTLIRTPVVTTPTPPTAPLPAPVVTAPVVTEAPTLIRTPVVTTPTPPTAPLPAPVVTAPVVTEAPLTTTLTGTPESTEEMTLYDLNEQVSTLLSFSGKALCGQIIFSKSKQEVLALISKCSQQTQNIFASLSPKDLSSDLFIRTSPEKMSLDQRNKIVDELISKAFDILLSREDVLKILNTILERKLVYLSETGVDSAASLEKLADKLSRILQLQAGSSVVISASTFSLDEKGGGDGKKKKGMVAKLGRATSKVLVKAGQKLSEKIDKEGEPSTSSPKEPSKEEPKSDSDW